MPRETLLTMHGRRFSSGPWQFIDAPGSVPGELLNFSASIPARPHLTTNARPGAVEDGTRFLEPCKAADAKARLAVYGTADVIAALSVCGKASFPRTSVGAAFVTARK